MIRSKVLDMQDLKTAEFARVNNAFNAHFGNNWPEVPLRRWEYCAAIAFSDVIFTPGKALDAGCGRSIFPKFLKKIGCDVYAIDPGIYSHDTGGVHYRKMSMTDLSSFDTEFFDYVFAMSSIEHVNAGRFAIKGMPFDTGDALAAKELCRVLKPGGKLVLTTDFGKKYVPPPGLWPSGSHRIYNLDALYDRLIIPAIVMYPMRFCGTGDLNFSDGADVKAMEPVGYDYTAVIVTLKKHNEDICHFRDAPKRHKPGGKRAA